MRRRHLHLAVVPVVLALAGAGGALVGAGPAAAHVTASADRAVQGGYARVAFRVPNESSTAGTTKLEIHLPTRDPLASVSIQPVPGWTATVTRSAPPAPVKVHGREITEIVSKIVWTASPAAMIRTGEFQEFPVSLGPLPQADRITFKALQHYSDGNVVRWIEEPQADGAELERPAPTLALVPAGAGAGTDAGADGSGQDSPQPLLPLVLSVLALAVGAAGLAMALLAFRRAAGSDGPHGGATAD